MARCIRGGSLYKRHQYANAITEVDGVTVSKIVCKACGKEVLGSIITFEGSTEIALDNGTEVL
jgi:molybdopterin-binding protein